MSNTTLSEDLQYYIERYFSFNPRRSRHTLSKKTGVSYSTLTRIMAGQGETSFEQSVKIMKEVAQLEELDRFVKKHFSDTYNVLDAFESKTYRSQDHVQAASQRQSFELMVLAFNKAGLAKNLVSERYGAYGLELCKDLVESGVFEYDANQEVYNLKDFPSNSLEIIMKITKTSLDNFFNISNRTTDYHFCRYTQRINQKACMKINTLASEFYKKASEIIQDPDSVGSIPYEYICVGKPTNLLSNEMTNE